MSEPCQCSNPGYCARHKIIKTEHLFKLCQSSDKQREVWDSITAPVKPPPYWKKVINYIIAEIKHTWDGRQHVTQQEYDRRIAACNSCRLLVNGECVGCGCPVEEKAAYRSQHCPEKKWPGEAEPVRTVTIAGKGGCGGCGAKNGTTPSTS